MRVWIADFGGSNTSILNEPKFYIRIAVAPHFQINRLDEKIVTEAKAQSLSIQSDTLLITGETNSIT
jgi:hypothetical protein